MVPACAAVSDCVASESDFVEIEDEDGEIVIIKSRTAFLEEQLSKLHTAAEVVSRVILGHAHHL